MANRRSDLRAQMGTGFGLHLAQLLIGDKLLCMGLAEWSMIYYCYYYHCYFLIVSIIVSIFMITNTIITIIIIMIVFVSLHYISLLLFHTSNMVCISRIIIHVYIYMVYMLLYHI